MFYYCCFSVYILVLDVTRILLGSQGRGRVCVEGLEDALGWTFIRTTGPKATLPSGVWPPSHSGRPSSSGPPLHRPPCLRQRVPFPPTGSRGKNTIRHLNSGSDSGKHLEVLTDPVFWFFLPLSTNQYLLSSSVSGCPLGTFFPKH